MKFGLQTSSLEITFISCHFVSITSPFRTARKNKYDG